MKEKEAVKDEVAVAQVPNVTTSVDDVVKRSVVATACVARVANAGVRVHGAADSEFVISGPHTSLSV
ncbi:hypothetical protein L1987_80292 [Smallanthus sonchifolius]|uniref:Uncharacterized protein n=1 Tax=Smallanthus sonchifolius TaxID=185202 RepID=A0ACB8YM72_9ASTR|nr:hypothetical protein L1987_80292 [Smallanthus sonchifolius]